MTDGLAQPTGSKLALEKFRFLGCIIQRIAWLTVFEIVLSRVGVTLARCFWCMSEFWSVLDILDISPIIGTGVLSAAAKSNTAMILTFL